MRASSGGRSDGRGYLKNNAPVRENQKRVQEVREEADRPRRPRCPGCNRELEPGTHLCRKCRQAIDDKRITGRLPVDGNHQDPLPDEDARCPGPGRAWQEGCLGDGFVGWDASLRSKRCRRCRLEATRRSRVRRGIEKPNADDLARSAGQISGDNRKKPAAGNEKKRNRTARPGAGKAARATATDEPKEPAGVRRAEPRSAGEWEPISWIDELGKPRHGWRRAP